MAPFWSLLRDYTIDLLELAGVGIFAWGKKNKNKNAAWVEIKSGEHVANHQRSGKYGVFGGDEASDSDILINMLVAEILEALRIW